ncbi:MAG TPA: DUF6586 family protein [Spongiibacteraceae bacterium]|jgi:hypothetical protein|nr:hypothetical protein [Spongiibacteraceae bacterium]HUH38251.1 DUF6586 family protein [Spongiibacteraceae bacterium]
MSASLRGRVNESLQAANALLQLSDGPAPSQALSPPQWRRVLTGSALYHLVCAYRVFLAEILKGYQVEAFPDSAAEAGRYLADRGRHSGEVEGLLSLEQGAWLGELLSAQRRFGLDEAGTTTATSRSSLAVELADDSAERARIATWAQQLQGIILDYSSLLDEW